MKTYRRLPDRWLRLVALLSVFIVVAAACSDGDSGNEPAAPAEATAEEADDESTAAEDGPAGEDQSDEAAAEDGPADEDAVAIPEERCRANEAAGTITYLTSFDYAAAAGIVEVVVADSLGYFDELCLDVAIEPFFAPANGALVIEGEAQVSTAGSFAELVDNNLAGGGDLVALVQWGRTSIEAIVIPEGVEVTSFEQLCDSVVGIKGDLPYSLQAAVGQAGIERGCFEEVLLDGFDPVAHLDLGIDALPVYKSNEPNTLTGAGVGYSLLDPQEFDVPSSFGIVFTSQAFLDANPTAVEDFTRAMLRGYEAAAADPNAAVAASFELINAAGNPNFLAEEAELFRWQTEAGLIAELTPSGVGPGIPDTALLGAEIEAMVDAGVFAELPDWESMVDPSVIEGLYDGTTLRWPTS